MSIPVKLYDREDIDHSFLLKISESQKKSRHFLKVLNHIGISLALSVLLPISPLINPSATINEFLPSITVITAHAADSSTGEESYINALSAMILAKDVIYPTNVAVDAQAYDNARTNIKYVINQLQFQRNLDILIKGSIDYSDDMDSIEASTEVATRMSNMLQQYDSSIYTCVFIPSEDGEIPPSAKKYRKEAINYYDNFLSDLDVILKLGSEKQLAAAKDIAQNRRKELPKVLFFDANALKRSGI